MITVDFERGRRCKCGGLIMIRTELNERKRSTKIRHVCNKCGYIHKRQLMK